MNSQFIKLLDKIYQEQPRRLPPPFWVMATLGRLAIMPPPDCRRVARSSYLSQDLGKYKLFLKMSKQEKRNHCRIYRKQYLHTLEILNELGFESPKCVEKLIYNLKTI